MDPPLAWGSGDPRKRGADDETNAEETHHALQGDGGVGGAER